MKLSLTVLAAVAALFFAGCQSVPRGEPVPAAGQAAESPAEPVSIGTVRVDASALNIRSEPSMTGEILTQVKRGERLPLLETGDSWMMVQLPDGRTGWGASRFLLQGNQKSRSGAARKGNCPPDSDFAFATPPMPTFSESVHGGEVVVDAHVRVDGTVKSTKIVKNTTGEEAFASLTEREIRSATFVAPVENCVAREFIYTYRRSF